MTNWVWKNPLNTPFTNVQKILALIVMMPAVPFVALICKVLYPGLQLQIDLAETSPFITFLLAANAGVVLIMAFCLPNAYKISPMYIGSGMSFYLVIVSNTQVPIFDASTWIMMTISAARLSYIRTKGYAENSNTQ